jgi:protein-tyrosine phosphatase
VKPLWVKTADDVRLAIVLRPRGGNWLASEMRTLRHAGVDVLVSMLPPEEAAQFGLSEEAAECQQAGIAYRSFKIEDRQVPTSHRQFGIFVDQLRKELHSGKSVAVHCRASIGRSSLLLACILCAEGWSWRQAFQRISEARGLHVPDTPEQEEWVERFASSLVRSESDLEKKLPPKNSLE